MEEAPNEAVALAKPKTSVPIKFFVISFVVLGLVALGIVKKGWFVAAMVNGQPITSVELLNRLSQEQGSQVLDNMVNEKIIIQEAKKNNALPEQAEIDSRIGDLEKRYGGAASLDNLLATQGQSRKILQDQIKIQLAAEKLYGSLATVSTQEVEDFVKQYKTALQSTDPAVQKEEAVSAIKQRKLGQIFSEKFQELKKNANVKLF